MTSKLKTLLVFLFVGMASIQAQTKNQNEMTQEEKKVLDAVASMTSSFEKGDINTVMQCYERHATVVFDPGKPVMDANVLKKMFEGMATANPKFEYSGHQVFVSGDIALHIAPWKMSAKTPDGQQIQQSGLSLAVLRKQASGDWLMVIDNPHGQMLLNK